MIKLLIALTLTFLSITITNQFIFLPPYTLNLISRVHFHSGYDGCTAIRLPIERNKNYIASSRSHVNNSVGS